MKNIAIATIAAVVFSGAVIALLFTSPKLRSDEAGMVLIPGGEAFLGDNARHSMPGPMLYDVKAFLIDRFEVTNKEYAAFVAATGRAPAAFADDNAFNQADQPVTGITWQNASDYCAWAGKRLPREAEWEKAARGLDARIYPWGNTLDITLAHLTGEAPFAVTSHRRDESPYGVRGMAGNVSEWVLDRQRVRAGVCGDGHHHHHKKAGGAAAAEHKKLISATAANQVATIPLPSTGTCAFIKGNSWSGRPHMTRLANRMWDYTDAIAEFVGFRCVRPSR